MVARGPPRGWLKATRTLPCVPEAVSNWTKAPFSTARDRVGGR